MIEFNEKNALSLTKALACSKTEPRKAALPCPECDNELIFPEAGVIHHNPPRKRVKCLECRYKGWHEVEDPGPSIDVWATIQKKQEAYLDGNVDDTE